MKRNLLTLCFALCAAMGLNAQSTVTKIAGNYVGNLYIAIMGEVDPSDEESALENQAVTLEAGDSENSVTLTVKDFSLDGETSMGDIRVENLPFVQDSTTGVITFGETAPFNLVLLPGTETEIQATVELLADKSSLTGRHLVARLNVLWNNSPMGMPVPIDVLLEGDLSHYQIPNSDFEIWSNENEPYSWHSFASASGEMASLGSAVTKTTTEAVTGRTGKALQIRSINAIFTKANGNVTTGRINMGDMSPAHESNYNYTDTTEGSEYGLLFAGVPDSISFYARYTQAEGNTNNGRGMFILHGNYPMKDPTPASESDIVQRYVFGTGSVTVTRTSEWTRFCAPMTYPFPPEAKTYLLASFTTNPVPGGSDNDTLQVDDIAFIYNSKLSSLTVGGSPVVGFDKDIYTYRVTQEYEEGSNFIDAITDAASALRVITFDEVNRTAEVTVYGNDYCVNRSNKHTYQILFSDTPTGISTPTVEDPDKLVSVYTIDGMCLRRGVKASEAIIGLKRGNYIIDGKKVNIR